MLPGGIPLFVKKQTGRILAAVGNGLAILLTVAGFAFSFTSIGFSSAGVFGGRAFGLVLVC